VRLALVLLAAVGLTSASEDRVLEGDGFTLTYPEKNSELDPPSAAVPFQLEYRKNSLMRLETERLTQPIDLSDEGFAQIFMEVQLERLRERVDVPLAEQRIRQFSWGPGVEFVYRLPSRDGKKGREDLVTEVVTTSGETLYRFTYWIPERDVGKVAAPFAQIVESFRPEGAPDASAAPSPVASAPESPYSAPGVDRTIRSLRERLAADDLAAPSRAELQAELAEALGWKAYLTDGASPSELAELKRAAEAADGASRDVEGQLALAWAAYHADAMVEMEAAIKEVKRLAPEDARGPLLEALWYGFNPEKAEAMARRALELDPKLVPAHFVKARADRRAGDLVEARRSLEETIRLDPGFLEARVELAEVLEQSGDLSGAADAYRAAVAAAPGNVTIGFRYALALRRDDRVDDAIVEYQRLIGMDGSLAEAHFNLAVLLLQEKQLPDEAARHFKSFLELDPGSDRAPRVRSWLESNGYR